MELRWWAIVAAGAVVAAAVTGWVLLTPLPRTAKAMRPLAHVNRLTGMPEYARLARIQFWSTIAAVTLMAAMFAAALVTTARPTGFSSATRNFEAMHPEDLMVCVGQPVTEPSTAGYLNYFAQQARSFDNQRIGLTSPSLRVVPLTRDHDYAGGQFSRYAALAGLQHQLDTNRELPGPQAAELDSGIGGFSRLVDYSNYSRSVADTLALCMAGFPSFEDKSTRRRSLIYLGYSSFHDPGDSRPSLFSDQQVKDMAAAAGVQVNVIARADLVKSPQQANEALAAIAAATGGRYSVYNPAGTAGDTLSGTDATLGALLDSVRDNPPNVVLPSGTVITRRSWDYPTVPLTCSLLAAGLLFASLAVLRR